MSLDLLAVPYPSRERELTFLQGVGKAWRPTYKRAIPPGPPARQQKCHLGSGDLWRHHARPRLDTILWPQIQQSQGIGEGEAGTAPRRRVPTPYPCPSLQNDWTETRVRVLHGTELFTIKKLSQGSIASRLQSSRDSECLRRYTLDCVSAPSRPYPTTQGKRKPCPDLIRKRNKGWCSGLSHGYKTPQVEDLQ